MKYDNLLDEVEQFANNKLKRKKDLETLVRLSYENEKTKEFEDLSFTAKYIIGLQRVLKKGNTNPEVTNLEQIKKDYSSNFEKVVVQFKEILSSSSEEIKNYFHKTYLELNQESFINLNELLEDLEWTKMYLNKKKRQ